MRRFTKVHRKAWGLLVAGALLGGAAYTTLRDKSEVVPSQVGLRFDLHAHILPENAESAFRAAIGRKMDLIANTSYSGTELFNNLASSNSYSGRPILGREWTIERRSPTLLKLIAGSAGEIYLGKAQEVEARDGHVLAIGIPEAMKPNQSTADTIDEIYQRGGFAILAHPLASHFGGVGEKEVRRLNETHHDKLFLEENAQCFNFDLPLGIFSYNARVRGICKELSLPTFYNSDNHPYGDGPLKYGESLHNFIPGLRPSDNMFEQIRVVALRHPGMINPEGRYNTISDNASWWWASIKKDPKGKLLKTAKHFLKGFKK